MRGVLFSFFIHAAKKKRNLSKKCSVMVSDGFYCQVENMENITYLIKICNNLPCLAQVSAQHSAALTWTNLL